MKEDKTIRYHINTYTSFSHNYVIALLSSKDADYRYSIMQSEEVYSRFEVYSDLNAFEQIRELSKDNNGTAFTIEHGTY